MHRTADGRRAHRRARPWSERGPRPRVDVPAPSMDYGPAVPSDQLRAIVPLAALAIAVVAAIADPGTAGDLPLAAVPVAAFGAWALVARVPLLALALAVAIPVVAAQRGGDLEPLMFEVSLLAFVAGARAGSRAEAAGLGLLAIAAPIATALVQQPSEIATGLWVIGIAFPWLVGRALRRQERLAEELDAARRELADQAVLEERRRIARDVHDLVGHGLAAVMLQIASARHVLRRDPDAADEALRAAEEVGRGSMRELRGAVGLLRRDEETAVGPPVAGADGVPALVEAMRAAGLDVELRTRGPLGRVGSGTGVALYRIAQEALANAGRHAPGSRTTLTIEVDGGHATLLADTVGAVLPSAPADPDRPRYGLVGMRERASGLGGDVEAGPTPHGWRVRCRLPLEGEPAR